MAIQGSKAALELGLPLQRVKTYVIKVLIGLWATTALYPFGMTNGLS